MTFIFESAPPLQMKFGSFTGEVGGKPFRRIWWLWFALAWTPLSLFEYQRIIASGQVEWRYK